MKIEDFRMKLHELMEEAKGLPLRALQVALDAERDRLTTQMRDRGFYGRHSPPDTPGGG